MIRRKRISFITADGSMSAAGKDIAFISYRHADKKHIKQVEDAFLKHTDYALWYDENLSVGESFDAEIMEAIAISHIFVAIVTPNYFEEHSYTYKKEIPLAKQYGLIPVAIICEKIDKEQLDFLKSWTPYVYDVDKIAFEQLITAIAKGVNDNEEEVSLMKILRKVDCSYITVSEIESLVKNYQYIKGKIDNDIAKRYARLLHFCGLAETDQIIIDEGNENE